MSAMAQTTSTRAYALRYAQLAAYAVVALLLAPSVRLAPLPLDDWAELEELSRAGFGHVLDVDRFGHLRPLKSALFWLLSRHHDWLTLWRCVALVCVLASARIWQLLCAALLKSDARAELWALGAALCWALNPITASTLCWLSTANLVVAGLGSLAYIWLLDRCLDGRSATRALLFAAFASLIVAVLSHELALLSPVLFVIYRRCRSASEPRRSVCVALVATAVCAVLWLGLYAASSSSNIAYRTASYPRALLLLNAPHYLSDSLRLWFWLPGRFGVLLDAAPEQQVWAGAVGWIAFLLLCLLLWQRRARDPVLTFGVLTCGLLLLPLTSFVPLGNTPVALHYLYLPGLGLALLLARAGQRLSFKQAAWLPAALLLLLTAAWLPEQRRVLAAWSDATSLYSATIQSYPDNVEARVNLTAIYLDAKKYAEAEALLSDSLARAPNELGLVLNRFKLLAETGKVAEALAFYDAHPQLDMPHLGIIRGVLLLRGQRYAQASAAFSHVLELSVQADERLAAGQGLLLALKGEHDDTRAQSVVEALLAEFPEHPELRLLLSQRP